MKGKIDKDGVLRKEVPGGKMVKCLCVNSAAFDHEPYHCLHDCVAFEGPLPGKECASTEEDGFKCIGNCDRCPMHKPTGRTIIKICCRELVFDEFEDERAPK